MYSSAGGRAEAQTPVLQPHLAPPQLLLHDCAGERARHRALLLGGVFGPSTGSSSGAEARAPREGALRLSDPYLLSSVFRSWGPGPPALRWSPRPQRTLS